MKSIIYKTKIDWWIGLLIMPVPLLIIALSLWELVTGDAMKGIGVLGIFAVLLLLYRLFIFPMRYTLASEELIVHLGLLKLRYPYKDILQIRESRSPLGGYGMSLDRLEITFRRKNGKEGTILISPREKEAFWKKMNARRSTGAFRKEERG